MDKSLELCIEHALHYFCCGWVSTNFNHILQGDFTATGVYLEYKWIYSTEYMTMNHKNLSRTDNMTTTKQSKTQPYAYFMGYTVVALTRLHLDKMAAISEKTFSNMFLWRKVLYFDLNFTEVSFWGPNWQWIIFGSGNGLAPNRFTDAYMQH